MYPDRAAHLTEYPFLELEDVKQVLDHAVATVDEDRYRLDRVA